MKDSLRSLWSQYQAMPETLSEGILSGAICTRLAKAAGRSIIPAETIPGRTKDFSQSAEEGPSIFPSM